MQCPNCRQTMEGQSFAGHYGKVVSLDLCFPCTGFWFDSQENLQLTPGAILRLFTIIHEKQADQQPVIGGTLRCPRCSSVLVEITDMQRSTRFHYFRCPWEHGRFITFFQFLREKNFVRSLNAKEIRELTQHIKTLNCSNCGAAVDLDKAAICAYCGTPISMLDSRQWQTTLRTLQQAEDKRQAEDPLLPTKLVLARLQAESDWKRWHRQDRKTRTISYGIVDLVQEGLAALSYLGGESIY